MIKSARKEFQHLGGVNRQPSNDLKFNRQPSKLQIDINGQKFQGISNLLY